MTRSTRSRRRVLTVLGVGAATALAGCTGDDGVGIGGNPQYEDGDVEDIEGEERSPEELTAAESVTEQEIHEGVTPLDPIAITDHEFVLEDGYQGATVQGTVENEGGDRVEVVEVRVRVYNDEGEQIGRYLDSTGDLDGETSWGFQVVILEAPADIADYDITVLGTPT